MMLLPLLLLLMAMVQLPETTLWVWVYFFHRSSWTVATPWTHTWTCADKCQLQLKSSATHPSVPHSLIRFRQRIPVARTVAVGLVLVFHFPLYEDRRHQPPVGAAAKSMAEGGIGLLLREEIYEILGQKQKSKIASRHITVCN
uniref:Putative secreted protein n=1 Tax=Anopheles darlingi TaxID=43151 RepID=A0A2M4D3D1_ANODA